MIRRNFLTSILALGAAPAIVRADSLMRVVPVDTVVAYKTRHVWGPAGQFYPRATDIVNLNQRMADDIARMLMQTNEILADLPWVEYESAKQVVRTGLPGKAGRRLYVRDYTVEAW